MTVTEAKIAGAPISWGVCEVLGWGYQMGSDRVLGEMVSLGLSAAEAGPDGFLPDDSARLRRQLEAYGLRLVGGFTPLDVLGEWQERLRQVVGRLSGAGASVVVLSTTTGHGGYDSRPGLTAAEWKSVLSTLEEASAIVADAGLQLALHPHVGTLVQTPEEIERVLSETSVSLCLDTGHVMAGGGDPAVIAGKAPERITHVHFKDVDAVLAAEVARGDRTYSEAVAGGLYLPLGQGDVDVQGIVASLSSTGYQGWYVLEQDVMLEGEPPPKEGPYVSVGQSLSLLRGLLERNG